ncbi:LamB/YcsF family protein [Nocardia amamiensis]|uniref:LamB/YcsF family protein n=1 Tax=Nocardia amamiensis TaxID=404578 RepID=UPI00082E474A|nr:5-oxoprolinase subunit PxpA [Nocardia amamiensis]
MKRAVDLVADLGEGFGRYRIGDDETLLDVVTSANIACGFHAGDPRIMDATVAHCVRRGVAVGAHPGFADIVGFGRRAMDLSVEEVRTDLLYQVGALAAFATAHGTRIAHIAPHGKLGNLVVVRRDYAEAVADAVAMLGPDQVVLTQEGELAVAARERGIAVGVIGMADRNYLDDGTLVRRTEPNALIHDDDEVVARTVRMVTDGLVRTITGTDISVDCDTVLLHGDTTGAVTQARAVRRELEAAGVDVVPLREVLAQKTCSGSE